LSRRFSLHFNALMMVSGACKKSFSVSHAYRAELV